MVLEDYERVYMTDSIYIEKEKIELITRENNSAIIGIKKYENKRKTGTLSAVIEKGAFTGFHVHTEQNK